MNIVFLQTLHSRVHIVHVNDLLQMKLSTLFLGQLKLSMDLNLAHCRQCEAAAALANK